MERQWNIADILQKLNQVLEVPQNIWPTPQAPIKTLGFY